MGQERLTKLYLDHMTEVERECLGELKELLLERIALFDGHQETSQQAINRIDSELKVYVCVCVCVMMYNICVCACV